MREERTHSGKKRSPEDTLRDQVKDDGGDFRHAHLGQAELVAANLSHASPVAAPAAVDPSRADLQLESSDRANLRAANLSGGMLDHANFAKANLANANLKGANLRFATLAAAELHSANLSGADLRYVRLKDADLTAANLSGAFLDYADFSDANLTNTNLCGAHLRYAKNLTPDQLEQARISVSTILPLHYLEPGPRPQTKSQARTRKRPLRVGGLLFIGLISALAPLLLVWRPPPPSGQTTPAIVPMPSVKPKLASLTPVVVAPGPATEAPDATRRIGLESLAAVPLYPTPLARDSAAMASAVSPVAFRPLPAQRQRIGDVTDVLAPLTPVTEADAPLRRLALITEGPKDVLSDTQSPLFAAVPPTIALAMHEKATKEPAIPAPAASDPLLLVISLSQQKLDIYRGTSLVASSKVSSGKRGYDTKTGVFSIIEKQRFHHSNLFSGAPMPWMQRITWSGTALHAGIVPGYPASHGCVRLPFSFAPKLFQMTNVGENVVVAYNRVVPKLIEHPNLFQPAGAEPQVSLALADEEKLVSDAGAVAALPSSEQRAADTYSVADDASTAPLRILITRRTERDRIIAVQYLLASLGYLKPQAFTGRVGAETIAAIKAFQKANGLQETGAFSDALTKAVYRVAGKVEPPDGHLFVRQDYRRVFDTPVAFRNPEKTLGTHVFTAMKFPPGNAKMPWSATSLAGDDSVSVLDRIEIPDEVRREISGRLTPGSSLIIAETSVSSSLLREGDDFIVWSNDMPQSAALDTRQSDVPRAKVKKVKTNRAKAPAVESFPPRSSMRVLKRRADPPRLYGGFWSFRRW